MTTENRHQRLIDRVCRHLDQRVDELDAATVTRLRMARQAALRRRPVSNLWLWPREAGWATAVIALFVITLWTFHPPAPVNMATSEVADIEILTSADNLEIAEELDFYEWLSDVEADAG